MVNKKFRDIFVKMGIIKLSTVLLVILISHRNDLHGQTVITVGGNYWYAMMDYVYLSYDSKAGRMFGPYIDLQFGKIVCGTSMFWGNFKFVDNQNSLDDLELKRTELDFFLGYAFTPMARLFAAYKSKTNKIDGISLDETLNYAGAGLSLDMPIFRESVYLHVNASYLSYLGNKDDVPSITTFDVGLVYVLQSGLKINGGYKGELYGDREGENRVHGFIVTVAFPILDTR